MSIVRLTRRKTTGCYFDDADGFAWSSFQLIGMAGISCAWCGAIITSGYWRGDARLRKEEQIRVCAVHVIRDDESNESKNESKMEQIIHRPE